MLYTKIKPQNFHGSGEEDFLVFLRQTGMAAILINEQWLFEQIFNPPLTEGSTWNMKIKSGPGVSEKSFKGVYGGMNGRWTASDHNSSSWAFGSGELKIRLDFMQSVS